MPYSKRRELPHWDPEDAALFITWRLHSSVPALAPEWEVMPAGKRFVAEDRALDRLATGPHYLKHPAVAACVAKALHYGANQLDLYTLHAWVIMSNHVHILIDPRAPMARITRAIKTYSAREANVILDRTGQPFWHIESYDRWVRNSQEFEKIIRYIEGNPVAAGLVSNPEDWVWSSAQKAGQEACGT